MSTIISVTVDGKKYRFDELILDNIFNYLNVVYFLNLGKINSEFLKILQIVKLVPHSIKLFHSEFTKEELKKLSFCRCYILNYLKKE